MFPPSGVHAGMARQPAGPPGRGLIHHGGSVAQIQGRVQLFVPAAVGYPEYGFGD